MPSLLEEELALLRGRSSVSYQDVFATLYHTLGIDAYSTTVQDPTGRPQYLLNEGGIIRELV